MRAAAGRFAGHHGAGPRWTDHVTDGPAAELKEQVGGYTLDCADLDQAVYFAAMLPAAKAGSVEVRAVIDTGGGAQAAAAARTTGVRS